MTRFITNYYIHNYLLSYSLFAHANITFELNTLQIYAKYLYVSIRMGCKHTIRLCKRLHDRHEDMFFLDKKTLNKLRKKLLVAEVSGLRSTISGTIH